jgi:hypothetical protein
MGCVGSAIVGHTFNLVFGSFEGAQLEVFGGASPYNEHEISLGLEQHYKHMVSSRQLVLFGTNRNVSLKFLKTYHCSGFA